MKLHTSYHFSPKALQITKTGSRPVHAALGTEPKGHPEIPPESPTKHPPHFYTEEILKLTVLRIWQIFTGTHMGWPKKHTGKMRNKVSATLQGHWKYYNNTGKWKQNSIIKWFNSSPSKLCRGVKKEPVSVKHKMSILATKYTRHCFPLV